MRCRGDPRGQWSAPNRVANLGFHEFARTYPHLEFRVGELNQEQVMSHPIHGVSIPDSKIAREITELVRDTESPLLFHHSSRVYYFGALAGKHRGLSFDPELLYAGAMFHDMGLTHQHSSATERFEVDSANAARDFLRGHGISQDDIETVWTAIALHTTPGIPPHMHPVVALLTAGVEMDVLGLAYTQYSNAEREAVVLAYPRSDHFKEDIIQAFYDGNKHKPKSTFGNVNADVIADKEPHFQRVNFCSVIRESAWGDVPTPFAKPERGDQLDVPGLSDCADSKGRSRK
jgi:hypothetical protein